jgi:hypothetical protein
MRSHDSRDTELKPHEVRVCRLIGRPVLARNNKSIGRLEEFRCELRGGSCVATEFVIGPAGLLERLGLGARLLFGLRHSGLVAKWDQIDLSDSDHPRLTAATSELREV